MNILLYVNSYLPSLGGREVVVHYLAREFKQLGHDVRVAGPAGWWKHRKLRFGYPVHRWPTLRGHFQEQVSYAQLRMDHLIWGADVIHAHSTYPNGYAAARLRKKENTPIVITPHGEDIHIIPEIGFGLRLDSAKNEKIGKALTSAHLVTAISESVRDSLKDAGVEAGKIRSVPNGIDIDRFNRAHSGAKDWLKIDRSAPVILAVGRYHPRKGFETLLHAMPEVLKQVPDATLVVVGETKGKLDPLVDRLSLRDNVRITGQIDFPALGENRNGGGKSVDRLAELYCAGSVYLSAAMEEGAEGLSLAMLDGMAAGLPVVATAISGNKDLVIDGENGLLVPPSNPEAMGRAIVTLLKDRTLAEHCRHANRRVAESYSWRSVAKQYLDIYSEAISLSLTRQQ